MKYLNKYRIRRMVLYFCVIAIIFTIILINIPWEDHLAWQLDYDRKRIDVKTIEPNVIEITLS